MQITFLGTGDMFSFEQDHNSAMITYRDTRLIIDFPESNAKVLHKLGIMLDEIEHIFITHLHDDHINGLQQLGYYAQVFGKHKPNLYIHEELIDPLWRSLGPGMRYTVQGERKLEDYFHLIPLREGTPFSIGGVTYELTLTQHVPGMLSCGLLAPGYFYYSGDATMDSALLEQVADHVQVIFYECHLQEVTISSHTHLDDIKALPLPIQAKTLLMHYHDGYARPEAREEFNREAVSRLVQPLEVIRLHEQ
ncbi:MBL fold metallo-hydrolase [Neobacillus mesonae]|nr:MBL fold metallo-hydrolase [Neobacillus mesonae]